MKELLRSALVALACLGLVSLAYGKEVPAGTVLNKSNIDSLLNDTLDGKTIKSLLTEKMEWLIRNQGFAMKLVNAKPIEVDQRWQEATNQNAPGVKFDPKSRTVSGWKGGLPFPNIDVNDPNAGDKVAWNARYGLLEGYAQDEPYVWVYLIDLDKGVERIQNWAYKRTIMNGRVGAGAGSPMVGDGTVFAKTLTFLTYPLDIRGIGFFSVRYMDPNKIDDKWVYINQFRRTKRVSGGGWFDPLGGGTDILVEDLNVWDTPPNWYPSVKLIKKRWLLVVAHAGKPLDTTKSKRSPEEAPMQDAKNVPYINTLNGWEPREVYELEITPAIEHPYGKRVIFIDAQVFQAYHSEIYDKKGEFYKFINYERAPTVGKDGFKGFSVLQGRFIDLKRRHATVWASDWIQNDQKINERTITAETLERESGN